MVITQLIEMKHCSLKINSQHDDTFYKLTVSSNNRTNKIQCVNMTFIPQSKHQMVLHCKSRIRCFLLCYNKRLYLFGNSHASTVCKIYDYVRLDWRWETVTLLDLNGKKLVHKPVGHSRLCSC